MVLLNAELPYTTAIARPSMKGGAAMSLLISIQAMLHLSGRRDRYVITFDPADLRVTGLYKHSFSPADKFGILPVALLAEAVDQGLLDSTMESYWKSHLEPTPLSQLDEEAEKHFKRFLRSYLSIEFPDGQYQSYGKFRLFIKSLGPYARRSTPPYQIDGELSPIHSSGSVSFIVSSD